MPISRYHIQSAHRLADPELHRAADKDDSEALLEAVAMAGLIGLLRQLGDLAQFAAEMFHNLHEEVMATAERGHGLKSRVQQLEADIPALEKAFLSQTHHSSFFTNGGIEWHPNLRYEQNPVTRGDLPRFILDSYEECHGPPRLFLLDKFDVAGAGACLKRYTDPSFFKTVSASSVTATEVHREKRVRRVRQKKEAWLRNGETSKPSHSKLHQLFLEEHIENACSDPARLVKLRKRQLDGSAVDAKTGKSYMEKFSEIPSPDHTMVCETSIIPRPVKWMSDDTNETGIKILDIRNISPMRSLENERTHYSTNEQELQLNSCSEMDRETNGYLEKVHEQISAGVTYEMSSNSNHFKVPGETEMLDDEQEKRECNLYGYHSDDATSEVDNYMDALATIDSELETDNECRPKKSLLNVQKITDLNGEERQLQAQFSDSHSFGDSSISEEVISFEQDQNDEHNEVKTWLPDSQSTGTPCASDDDCSLRRDRNEEHTQLQLQFSDSQSIGNSPEIELIPSNQLLQTVELQNTSGEFVTHDDAHDQREMISDSIPVSSGSCMMDSGHSLFPSDLGVTSLVPLPTGTQSDKTPSVPVERHLRLEDDEDRKCLVESIAAESHAASPLKDGCFPVVSFDCGSLSNLDVCDPYVHSNSELQVSNDLNMFHEGDGANHSDVKVLQADSLTEYSSETSAVEDIGSQVEDPIRLSMEGDLNSGTKLLPDDRNLNSEDNIVKTQLNSEDSFPVVDTTPESSFTEELCSDLAHGNPQDLPDLAEVEIVYPDQQSNFEEVPRIMPGHEINGSTCSLDSVEDDAHSKHPPSPDYMRQDNHVDVNDMFSVKGQSQDQAVSAPPCVDTAEKDASIVNCRSPDCISSPSRNISNSHEPLLCSSESHQMEMESDEVELTKFSIDLNAEKRENQLEPFSEILSSSISLTKLEESLSCFADPREEKMELDEAGARESLTELPAHKVVDQPEIASIDAQLNLNKSVLCAPSDSGICNNVQHSSLEEKIQYGSSLNDVQMVSECSEPDSQRSESMFVWQNNLQNSKDSLPPPSYNQLDPETHLELFLKSQVGQQDMRFQLRNEENYSPTNFQPQLAQISNQLEQERISNASEFAAEVHPDKPSCGSLLKSSGQKINSSGLLSDHFPKATNFEETPPMPPLPPMQWIMSKVQNTSLVSQREEIDESQASFQPIQSIKPDYKSEFGLSTSERATLPYQNPFSPAVAVENNKYLRSSGLSAGVSEHPVAIPLQFPLVLNEANGQHNYLILERSQAQKPFLTLPVVLSGRLPHGNGIASEGESVLNSSPCPPIMSPEYAVSGTDPIFQQEKSTQSSSQLTEDTSLEAKEDRPGELHLVLPAECPVSGDDPISPIEKPSQSLNQFMEETTLEVKTLEQSSINLEKKQGDPVVSPESPPSVEIVQPNHSLVSSEGKLALSLDTSARTSEFDTEMPNGEPNNELPCPPEFDTEMPNGKPKNKLPRPPNPVIDVAAALDKSRLRKASDRVRPQIAPKVDERDSLLEQIRSKSFNLKPAVVTRPSIPGPKTNLRVAAILEKANSIRQAFAGSDEDDGSDSWSE